MKSDLETRSGWLAWRGVAAIVQILAFTLLVAPSGYAQGRIEDESAARPLPAGSPVESRDLDAAGEYPVTEPAELEWTSNPGAFEVDLIRRNANPFYPMPRQLVTEADLQQAKIRDADDAWNALDEFIAIQLGRKKAARFQSIDEIEQMLERIGAAIQRNVAIDGQGLRLAKLLRELRGQLIAEWRQRRAEDPVVLDRLASLESTGAFDAPQSRDPLVATLLREDGPILKEDQVSVVLSEDASRMPRILSVLPPERQLQVRRQGVAIVRDLQRRGVEVAGLGDKLVVLYGKEGPAAFP